MSIHPSVNPPADPFDKFAELGYRIVWMEDFEDQVYFVDDVDVALIDRSIPRITAARTLRELLGLPCLCRGGCGDC